MSKIIFPVLLIAACALTVVPQSGRRTGAARTAPIAPVQPPANPQPEPEPEPAVVSGPLLFLPLSLRERQISALDSGTFRFDDFQGNVLVINLWASWCGPCRREVPEYEGVRKAYAGRKVEFIGLTTENPETDVMRVNKFLRDVSFGFRLGWADDQMADFLMNGRDSIPQTLVIDAGGRVIKHWTGYTRGRSGERLKEAIDHALLLAQ